jgi:hypothetical protein
LLLYRMHVLHRPAEIAAKSRHNGAAGWPHADER